VKAEGIGALAFIPLMAKGVLVGKFMTYYKTPHAFRDTEIDLAVTIVRQLGFSVERMNAVNAEHRAYVRQELLAREAQHRTKDLLSVVQAIVARSFANKRTVQEAQSAVRDRLHFLAQLSIARAAAEIEPVSRMLFSSAALPGPMRAPDQRPPDFPPGRVHVGRACLSPIGQHRRLGSSMQLTHDQRHQVFPDLVPRYFDGRALAVPMANA
jgi:hypothetical protein